MNKNYTVFSKEDFLEDPEFIQWVKYKTPELSARWNSWLLSSPPNINEFKDALIELNQVFGTSRILPDIDDTQKVWTLIEQKISEQAGVIPIRRRDTLTRIHPYKKWLVACSLLIIAVGYLLYDNFFSSVDSSHVQHNLAPQSTDILPGMNMPTLTLSNGEVVRLDSMQAKRSVEDGQVFIEKKADGTIVYHAAKTDDSSELQFNIVNVPKGSKVVSLLLSDGTLVWLNAGSTLKYPNRFSTADRTVSVSGEAYFEVYHNAAKPFNVVMLKERQEKGKIRVLGTKFNVNCYENGKDIRTTLLQGSVVINNNVNLVKLKPGEQSRMTDAAFIEVKENIDVEKMIAWKNGFISFDNESVQEVMKKIERHYDIAIEYQTKVPDLKFSGDVDAGLSLSQMLDVLSGLRIQYKLEGKKLIVKKIS